MYSVQENALDLIIYITIFISDHLSEPKNPKIAFHGGNLHQESTICLTYPNLSKEKYIILTKCSIYNKINKTT